MAEDDDEGKKKPRRVDPPREYEIYEVKGDTEIGGNITAGDIVGDVTIQGDENIIKVGPPIYPKVIGVQVSRFAAGRDINIDGGQRENLPKPPRETLSSEQALGRIADAVRLNLGQLQLNMEQARRESSQFFRTTMIFSGVGFAIILGGVGMMLGGLVCGFRRCRPLIPR